MLKESINFILVGFLVIVLISVMMVLISVYDLVLYIVGGIVLILVAWFIGYIVLAPFIKGDE